MIPHLSETEWVQFAVDTLSDVAARPPVKRGGHQRSGATGIHVGYPASANIRVSDLPRRRQLAIRALEEAGWSRSRAALWVAQRVSKPATLASHGVGRERIQYLLSRFAALGVGDSPRGRKLKRLGALSRSSPALRKCRRQVIDQNPNPSRVSAAEIAEIEAEINRARKAQRGTVGSIAAGLRSSKRIGQVELESDAWRWWWAQPFRRGDCNPLTGLPIADGEFPYGWLRMTVRLFGCRFEPGLGWRSGGATRPAEAEGIARAMGHLPANELAPPGSVPAHLRYRSESGC